MNKRFKQNLKNQDLQLGTIMTLPSPEMAEILLNNGFDWLFLDMEHGVLDLKAALRIMQTVGEKLPVIVRVPALDEIWIKKVLDLGVSGIIIPQVQSGKEAELAVSLCKYPPEGARSVGIARAQGYGSSFTDCMRDANNSISIIVQIEHIRGVENIDEILNVRGIDAVFIGPYDLSASMGVTGDVENPEVQKAIRKVVAAARARGISLGIFGATPSDVKPYLAEGFTLIATGIDTMIFQKASAKLIEELK